MKNQLASPATHMLFFISFAVLFTACSTKKEEDATTTIKQFDTARTAQMAAKVDSLVKPELGDSSLSVHLWGVDSLVISPIAIDIDDQGRLYYTTTDRQKHSEFDIRGHPDWEIPSIQLQTTEERRAFLHKELSPENSKKNLWLADLNGDSSHDWKDLTVEKEHVYRLEDINGDGVADKSQHVVDDFHDEVTDVAGGLLADGDDLFVAVGPDLWRMKDKNGDGIEDEKTSISHGYAVHIGFSGHGMSGVEMGPDGRIYWQIGDIGFNGTDKSGKKWEYPNSGVIARSNPDGSDFEIFAAGLRNTHEFAFDEYGNLLSEDNDGDHPGEKERLVYVVNGSDAGWRSNWQYGKYNDPNNNRYKVRMDEKMFVPHYEGQAAYITPPIANYVSGPAGFVYNPGTALNPQYKNTFFVAEFVGNPAQSGVYGFKLNPAGATFTLGESKKVLGGVLPTSMDFGPDGALYVADWIDGWGTHSYGRIWKMDDNNAAASALRQQTKTLLASDFTKMNETDLGALLMNEDMRVRLKAQFELVKRGDKGIVEFQKALKQTANQLARVQSIWGIAQAARSDAKQGGLLLPLLKDSDPEIRAQAAKWLGDIRYAKAGADLLPLLKDTFSRARFFAAEALGRIAYEPAINPIIDMLQANNDADTYLRHAGSLALSRIGKAEPIVALSNHPSKAVRMAAVVTLRRMSNAGVANFLADKDEYIVTEAARAINDDLSIPGALPALGNILTSTTFNNEPLIRRAINACLRVGSSQSLQNLLTYATATGKPSAMRAEAIAALSTWAKPSVVDRVDGRYRGVITRDAGTLKNAAGNTLTSLVNDKDSAVRISAVKAVAKLGVKEASPFLLSHLETDPKPAVRVEALKALATLEDEHMSEAITHALSDKDKIVRIAGIDLIEHLNISKDLMVSLLSGVINTKTTEEKQAALQTLGRLPAANTGKVFDGLLTQMEGGKLPPEVYLELGDALDSSHSSALVGRFKAVSAKFSTDDLLAAYSGCLTGGNPETGRWIFFNHETAQCMRCHSYDDMGGNAGPRLNGVASRITRPMILQALVEPSARLAPGFGIVTLTLKDGKTVSGVLQSETNTSLVLKVGDAQQALAKTDVVKRINAASSMPEMRYILTKKEIRDVVSFLAMQKE